MDIFKCKTGIVNTEQLHSMLLPLNLSGKSVIIYSRLLGLGRFFGGKAVTEFIHVLKEHVGEEGNIVIPAYTLNSYKEPRVFNIVSSKVMSGVLGEIACKDSSFKRTIHPVYSHCVWGQNTDYLLGQDATTCFGEDSLFDRFSKLENAYVLMVGLNFNGPTLYHYYDQKFCAPGRLLKNFYIKMELETHSFGMQFNSYVKDYDFYNGRMNCLAKFHALLDAFKLVTEVEVGDNYIFGINEKSFQDFYKVALDVKQSYFLLSDNDEWEEYYMRNNHFYFRDKLDTQLLAAAGEHPICQLNRQAS